MVDEKQAPPQPYLMTLEYCFMKQRTHSRLWGAVVNVITELLTGKFFSECISLLLTIYV